LADVMATYTGDATPYLNKLTREKKFAIVLLVRSLRVLDLTLDPELHAKRVAAAGSQSRSWLP
jgi:hypothetical protein